jgi:glyceraldehyde 3-phosphate dehydrogenase
MAVKVGINGFGRIGRLTFKTIQQYHSDILQVVAVNDLTDTRTNAHLLKWDSTYGKYPEEIESSDNTFKVGGREVRVFAEREPGNIPWKSAGVDIVIESTGLFTDGPKAAAHLKGGAKKVIISAPARNEDVTIVLGVNQDKYNPARHNIISNASCTTNAIAPIAKVLNDGFGITKGLMTTVHAYTNDQRILDTVHRDLRRARSAAMNIIPTTTGAASLVGQLIPELKGKVHGISLRVPVPTVSIIDFVCEMKEDVTLEKVTKVLQDAAAGPLKGILEYCTEQLVSMDFKGNTASSIIDAASTMVIGGNLVKVIAWYDNEWGYSCRLADLAAFVSKKGF